MFLLKDETESSAFRAFSSTAAFSAEPQYFKAVVEVPLAPPEVAERYRLIARLSLPTHPLREPAGIARQPTGHNSPPDDLIGHIFLPDSTIIALQCAASDCGT